MGVVKAGGLFRVDGAVFSVAVEVDAVVVQMERVPDSEAQKRNPDFRMQSETQTGTVSW